MVLKIFGSTASASFGRLTEEKPRRVPAAELRDVALDELTKSGGIFVNTPKIIALSGADEPADPLPGMSMKTRSVRSSRLFALSATRYGGGPVNCPGVVRTMTGPNDPMRSHIVELPGPPL